MLNFPWGYKYKLGLFNPGLAFLITGVPIAAIWGRKGIFSKSLTSAIKGSLTPFLVIISMSTTVQLMINSDLNISDWLSSLATISKVFEINSLPFFAPFIGAFGGFITGSVTVSNIMFGNFLTSASQALVFIPQLFYLWVGWGCSWKYDRSFGYYSCGGGCGIKKSN